MVGLDDFAGAYPRELSGGMKMRVSIARALDHPAEAAAHGRALRRARRDHPLQAQQRPPARSGRRFGWTVIFVTHSVFESVYLSERIVVMAARPGRVFADLAVDAPYPRDDDFRTSAVYNEILPARPPTRCTRRSDERARH